MKPTWAMAMGWDQLVAGSCLVCGYPTAVKLHTLQVMTNVHPRGQVEAWSRPKWPESGFFCVSDVPSQTRVANHFAVAPSVHGVPHLHGSMRLVEPHRTI